MWRCLARQCQHSEHFTHTHARAHAPAHTRSQNAPDTERTSRMCSLCSFIFQRANNTWRNTAGFNQISDDNLPQISMRLRKRTKLNEKRRTYKVEGRREVSKKTTEERNIEKKTARRNDVYSPFVVFGEGGCFCVSLFFVHHSFSLFRAPPQFYPDVLLLFLLRLFLHPCRAMQPLPLRLCYHLVLCHLRYLLFFLSSHPSPLPPLWN